MARRPRRRPPQQRPRRDDGASNPPLSDRDKIIEAFFALLAEQAFEGIGYADLAARAGVSLATLRREFGSKLPIVAAYVKAIDRKVLAEGDADMVDEPPRERLFDVLMRRLEALAPDKAAIRSLMRSARRHPSLALAFNRLPRKRRAWQLHPPRSGPPGRPGCARPRHPAACFRCGRGRA